MIHVRRATSREPAAGVDDAAIMRSPVRSIANPVLDYREPLPQRVHATKIRVDRMTR